MGTTRRPRLLRWLAVAPLAIPVAGALAVRFRLQGPLSVVRRLNKRTFNRLTIRFAGRPGSPFALVRHVGRHSGREYTTPVMAARANGGFDIGLTYGPGTDWCRNVMAAGRFVVVYDGGEYEAIEPEVVPAAIALPSFHPAARIAARIVGLRQFLHVKIEAPARPM